MTGPAPIPRVRRSTLGGDVYETIKALVMEHTLPPGDKINIDALARELDVSPTPVREALARLESDGLVRKRPLAGYTVSPLLTRVEFTDMFDTRLVREGAAARWAAARWAAERWAAERSSAGYRAEISTEADATVAPRGDLGSTVDGNDEGWPPHVAFTALDARFHDLIAEAAGNPLLRDSIGRLHAHLHLHRLYFPFAQAGTTGEERRQIPRAIGSGDPDAAEAAMRQHRSLARERHLRAFD